MHATTEVKILCLQPVYKAVHENNFTRGLYEGKLVVCLMNKHGLRVKAVVF